MSEKVAPRNSISTLKDLLAKNKEAIAAMLPKHLTIERQCKIALVAASRNPKLLECTSTSLLRSIMDASQCGLECDGPMQQAYLVPYWNKKIGARECQLIIGYRGLVDLARRSGEILSIQADVVREGDKFIYRRGIQQELIHEVDWAAPESAKIICAYAVAHLKGGGHQIDAMRLSTIEEHRARSNSADSGPWVTDFAEMARKTVVKRLAKLLPRSIEFAKALDIDNKAENSELPMIEAQADDEVSSGAERLLAQAAMGVTNGKRTES